MIDLTPLDVRKKRDDIARVFRGYDPEEVDTFLEIVADRMEELVTENMTLKERSERLAEQVESLASREHAVHEALVTAQELSSEISDQARREAQIFRREVETEIDRVRQDVEERIEHTLREADQLVERRKEAVRELERIRTRFLRSLRGLLEKELDAVAAEEEAQEGAAGGALDFDLGDWRDRLRSLDVEMEPITPDRTREASDLAAGPPRPRKAQTEILEGEPPAPRDTQGRAEMGEESL